jgi:hypothetical protein
MGHAGARRQGGHRGERKEGVWGGQQGRRGGHLTVPLPPGTTRREEEQQVCCPLLSHA